MFLFNIYQNIQYTSSASSTQTLVLVCKPCDGFKFSHSLFPPAIHNVSFCALASWATVCQGSTLLQFCYKIQWKPNQFTWYQPWAVTHLSPLPGYPIPILFTDPPVTSWPSPKVVCPFGTYVHPRPDLFSCPHSICTHLNRTKYTKTDPLPGQTGQICVANRQSPMKICWWDAPLTLHDSAEAIHL